MHEIEIKEDGSFFEKETNEKEINLDMVQNAIAEKYAHIASWKEAIEKAYLELEILESKEKFLVENGSKTQTQREAENAQAEKDAK